jgi:hypothetical protein
MIHGWRTRFGKWVLRPAEAGAWELCWHSPAGQPVQAVYYSTPNDAIAAIRDHATGISAWDQLIGHPYRMADLSAWERVESLPDFTHPPQ